jgi:hypothetical protein
MSDKSRYAGTPGLCSIRLLVRSDYVQPPAFVMTKSG